MCMSQRPMTNESDVYQIVRQSVSQIARLSEWPYSAIWQCIANVIYISKMHA